MPSEPAPLVEARGISRSFPGVVALDGVDLTIRPDEVVGLVGENGAGKSTLLDVLSGSQAPDGGELWLRGHAVRLRTPEDALALGVFRVFQEQGVIGRLTVYENLCLGMERRFSRGGVLNKGQMRRHAIEAFALLELPFDVDRPARDFSFGVRQLVELTRVVAMSTLLGVEHPIVLLDEPTAALSGWELELFFTLLQRLRETFGASVLFVSHRLEEVLGVSDRVCVMKDGRMVAEVEPTLDEQRLHRLMVGRERASHFYSEHRQREPLPEPLLQLDGLSSATLQDVSLTLHRGEILGIGGLLASGKTELGAVVYGAASGSGRVLLEGAELGPSVRDRIAAGMGYIPLDRHTDGILLGSSIIDNVTLPSLPRLSPLGLRRRDREEAAARDATERLEVKAVSLRARCATLSGGNQQKVVFAKWLAAGLRCLVADNPTRGVDAGAKEEIYGLLRDLAAQGVGILLITDDLLELIGLSNRILIMREGRLSEAVTAPADAKPAEHDLVKLMV